MKRIFWVIGLVASSLPTFAGHGGHSNLINYARLGIKIPVTNWIEPDQSAGLAIEYRPSRGIGVQLETRYIFSSFVSGTRTLNSVKGFVSNVECRFYDQYYDTRGWTRYIGLQGHFKMATKEIDEWEDRGSYQEQKPYTIQKNNAGICGIVGVSKVNHVIGQDFTIGLGAQLKNITIAPDNHFQSFDSYQLRHGEFGPGVYLRIFISYKITGLFFKVSSDSN